MNFIDAGESPFHFFAGYKAFTTLLILNGIFIAAFFAIGSRWRCSEVSENAGDDEPLNINDAQNTKARI